jgi:hypothetical protein
VLARRYATFVEANIVLDHAIASPADRLHIQKLDVTVSHALGFNYAITTSREAAQPLTCRVMTDR